ncbi:MAG: tRNA (adenosine(37)-N6)-threonylcarbamoyltransferase complex transferase subunit TsaD, partial [Comamonas sp.]
EDPPEFPFIALLVSGGHSQLMRVDGVGRYEILGETIDDAAGEAFDKSAKVMGLPYPGGPILSKLAESGDPEAFKLPRPLLHSGDLDFSFAGLKTAVLTQAKKLGDDLEMCKADLAASTQAAIVDVLVKKTINALKQTGMQRVVVAGGVGANKLLREQLNSECAKRKIRVHYPELHLCTDNGAMIAMAAAMRIQAGQQQPSKTYAFDVKPRWPLDSIVEAA